MRGESLSYLYTMSIHNNDYLMTSHFVGSVVVAGKVSPAGGLFVVKDQTGPTVMAPQGLLATTLQ
jgi:hypothetical protein